ncbi:pilin, partial [Patescibacteria group bacterium]|nr:pilin [Patescibacteria group bacterium]
MKKYIKISAVFIFLFAVGVSFAGAQGTGIWKDTNCAAGSQYGGPVGPCDFCDAIIVVKNIIDLLLQVSLIIATIMIVVGGITIMIAGGSEPNIKKGKNMITKAITGVIIALVSWTIVGTVVQFLSGNPSLPWNQISCTHNPQIPVLTGLPPLQNASTTYAKVSINDGTYVCSKSGQSCVDIDGTFCANEPCMTIDKSLCGTAAPTSQLKTVWRDNSSAQQTGNVYTYQCYDSEDLCAANTKSLCMQSVTTLGNTYVPAQPKTVYGKIDNNGVIQCASSCDAITGPLPAYAACMTPGTGAFYFPDDSV